jgi:mono/diheme cytochrome c family protein
VRRALPLLGALVLLAGCGTGGKAPSAADQANGKKLFTSAGCGGCHVLADAGAKGTVGPNLDDAFAGDRAQGFKESTIENVVLDQIREANPPMPKNLVKGQDAVDVAAYVAAVAGTGNANAKPPSALGNDGKAIFQADCASCHTLAAAGRITSRFVSTLGRPAEVWELARRTGRTGSGLPELPSRPPGQTLVKTA